MQRALKEGISQADAVYIEIDNFLTLNQVAVKEVIANYVSFFNSQRPCWALGYDVPDKYYQKYISGEIEHKETFKNRVLSETPKFVQKKLESTSENKNKEKSSELSTSENAY